MNKKVFLIFSLLITSLSLYSQSSGTIRGYIFDKDTGEPIISAYVLDTQSDRGTTSDAEGFFSLDFNEGDNELSIVYIGYDTLSYSFSIRSSEIQFKNFEISESSINLDVVDISAARQSARSEVEISKVSIDSKKILKLPSIGGEADIAQYLQMIPGIISTGDQGGQIFIRGGSPTQNKILLDGLTIFNPFHSIGFFSIFETDLLRNVDVYTGGFSAEYGGRISAIVDIQTKDGNRKSFGGQVSANPFLVKAYLEGPIVRYKEGSGSTSFVLSGKKSLIDQTSNVLYPHAAYNDSIGLPFNFTDVYGKVSFINQNGSKLNLFGFNFLDGYNNPQIANLNWSNAGGGADFRLIPGNSSFILNGMIGYSDYQINLVEDDGAPRMSRIRGLNALIDFNFFSNNSELNYGFEFNSINTFFRFQNPFRIILGQEQNTAEIAAFGKYRYVLKSLILDLSFRLQYYASFSQFSPEPRFGLKYNLTEKLRVKIAGGLYSQNLLATSNERDVVNLFTGFLSGPEEQIFVLNTSEVAKKNIQTASHLVFGIEKDIGRNILLNLEAYYKNFDQLIIVNRNKLQASDPNFSTEKGSAYGFDVSFEYINKSVTLNGNYALGFVFRNDGEQIYPPVFDRRHNVNILGSYSFGSDKTWSTSIRWNMGSGFPFTRTQGFYNYNPFQEGLGTNILQDNPENVGIIYENDRNAGRLPYYHRLDYSISKKLIFNSRAYMLIDASITNVYNRNNIFYFDRVTYDRVDQLPILVSLGVKINF